MSAYRSQVIELGASAVELLAEQMVILFDRQAPEELREYCVIHEGGTEIAELRPGMRLWLGDDRYTITAVGELALGNLNGLGHITLYFDGANEPKCPGCVHLEEPFHPFHLLPNPGAYIIME